MITLFYKLLTLLKSLAVYLIYTFYFVLFVLEFYGKVNNEVMSSRSGNSGTVHGQA